MTGTSLHASSSSSSFQSNMSPANNNVFSNSNASRDGDGGGGGGGGPVAPNTNTKVTAEATAAASLGLFADVHSLVEKVHQLLLEEEEEFDATTKDGFEVDGGSTDRHQLQYHHQQQQRDRRRRREKAVREKELRQCLRKLHTIFQNEELHKVLEEGNDEDCQGKEGGYDDRRGGSGGRVVGMDEGYGDDDEKQEVHQQRQQRQSHNRHELITGFTEDLIELMTTTSTTSINDPSVVQLWKTLVPYSAILLPTAYLTEDQIWKLFVCVLQQLHELDHDITHYLYLCDQQQYAYGRENEHQSQQSHDDGRMDFSVTDGTTASFSVAARSNTTSASATATASHHQWPPSEIDREAFQGLLGQLLGALELNPTYFDGVLPPNEADEVLMRPIKFLCRLTRLEEQQQQQQQQQQQSQHYGGLPLDLVFSLRVLVDHFLTNLKSAVVLHEQHEDEDESSTLSFREWLQRKKKNNQINQLPSSNPANNHHDDDDDSELHNDNIIFNFLDEYAMDLADQAIHYLHDVETKTFLNNDDGERQEKDTSSHGNTEDIITALQYANLASNFFFHTEQDGFYHSPQLQGLSRSLWHAVGEFALLAMESNGGGVAAGRGRERKGQSNQRPFLSLEWEATLTESLFRLTKTQIVCSPVPLTGPTSTSADRLQDKELDFVVTTILRLLDNSARSIFSNDDVVIWVDELLKYSSFGRDKLLPPLRAALLSTICISGNYDTEKHECLVSSLLKLTGLTQDDEGDDGTPQPPHDLRGQPETVNDVWKEYMLDQIYGKSFNDSLY